MLRALRDAAGATQAGWAARLGFGRATVQRWESGELAPGHDAEAALIRLCADRGLFRTYYQGPLRGVTVSAELLRDLLAEARLHAARPRDERRAPEPIRHLVELPRPRTSFIGRDNDLARTTALLRHSRLVTLTGPGGAGKTRLAIEIARASADEFADGVWFADLSAISDATLVARTVGTAVGVRERPGESAREVLVARLQSASALLVLDNCEHLVRACAQFVDDLLGACPTLHVLATSREALGVSGEQASPLSGLDLATDAIQLFVERARLVRPDFELDEPYVTTICERLDGLPLAIELAAARVGVLTPAQIAERLDDHLRLLSTRSVGVAARHQTLRAALDWSYDLLQAAEQSALRSLAVFAGSWSLDAAQAVLEVDHATVLELLTSLTNRSLIQVDARGEAARYRLLETVRQYALDRVDASGEGERARDRHLRWCLLLAHAAEPHLRGAQQAMWLERLEDELDNIRAALSWALQSGLRTEDALRIASLLRWFWFMRGRPAEGRAWLSRGLASASGVAPAVRARALDASAALAHNQGDYLEARSLEEEALRISRIEGDRRAESGALSTLGIIAKALGQHEQARTLLQEALQLALALGELPLEATIENNLAALAMDVGDYVRARELLQDSLAIKRQLDDAAGIATSLYNLGDAALHLGDYAEALAYLTESMALFRRLDATDRIAQTLHGVGVVALRRGDVRGARASLAEALSLFRRNGDGWGQTLCIEALAEVAVAEAQPELAARLLGASEAWRQANAAPLPPNDRADHERVLALTRAALSETQFAAARAEGRAHGLEAASSL